MRKTFLTGRGTIKEPTEEQIVREIHEADKPGVIDEVSLSIYDDEARFNRRIYFWIKSDTELVAFFESSQSEHDLISTDGSDDGKWEPVPYYSGGEWPVGNDTIISTEQGIDYALELLRTGDINTEKGWRRHLP